MFRDDPSAEHLITDPSAAALARPGLPVDPVRLWIALRGARRWLVGTTLAAAVAGAVVGKFILPKAYVSTATVLWEPAETARPDAMREVPTLAQSVKLPANLRTVRDRLHLDTTIKKLANRIDTSVGDSSLLVTVSARAETPTEAAQLAQTSIEVFVESERLREQNKLGEVVVALRRSLAQAEGAEVDARNRYDSFRQAQHVDDYPSEVQAAISEVARLRVAARDVELDRHDLEVKLRALRKAEQTHPEHVVLSHSEQQEDEIRLGHAEADLVQLRAKFTDSHPKVISAEAQIDALRVHARATPATVTGKIIGRNPVRESLALQLEESTVSRTTLEERARSLAALTKQTSERASQLSDVQGEAARLLSDVRANEEHVALLLKQIAMAEDDVRSASSSFHLVSSAALAEQSEKGMGRLVALLLPAITLLLALLVVIARELRGLRVRTPREAAYWISGPVIAASSWPRREIGDEAALTRACADEIETRAGIVALATLAEGPASDELSVLLAARLRQRGRSAHVLTSQDVIDGCGDGELTDWFEDQRFGAQLENTRTWTDHVLLALPGPLHIDSLRAAMRWVDTLLLIVPSGQVPMKTLAALRAQSGLDGRGLAVVVVDLPEELIQLKKRCADDPQSLWKVATAPYRPGGLDTESAPLRLARTAVLNNGGANTRLSGEQTLRPRST